MDSLSDILNNSNNHYINLIYTPSSNESNYYLLKPDEPIYDDNFQTNSFENINDDNLPPGFQFVNNEINIFDDESPPPQNIEPPNQLNQNIPNEAKTTIPTTQMNINPEIRIKKTTTIFKIKKEKKIGRRKRKKQDIINLKRKMF